MIWKRLCLLNAVFLAGLLLTVTLGTLVALARSQDDQPALPRLNSRLDIMRHDKWPAQLSGSTGIDRIQSTQPAFAPDRVLVKLHPSVKPLRGPAGILRTGSRKLDRLLAEQGIERVTPLFPALIPPDNPHPAKPADLSGLSCIYRLQLKPGSNVLQVATALTADPDVEYAEPDYIARQADAPDDPRYGEQWALQRIQIEGAWTVVTGTSAIVIAMVDSGIDLEHPDLAPNLWTNPGEVPDNGVDDDGNGFVDDVRGWNFIAATNDVGDDNGHGTLVAGIVAARTDNGTGIAGVCGQCRIMPVKAMQPSGVANYSDIAAGVAYAAAKGARVINLSLGGYARSQVEEDALAVAFGQAVLVAAAGNDGKVNLPCPFGRDMYPAAYNWVLGVMASTQGGGRAAFSNFDCTPHDSHEYELMAPGVDVWSTLPKEQYAAWDGTSMATPIVSGIAALARTKWSDKDVYSSRFIMGQIAANTQGGIGGVADAYAALTRAPQPELSYLEHWLFDTAAQDPNNDDDGIVDAGETIDLAIVIRNHWGKADPVTVTLEAWAEGAFQPDPYVTMITDTVSYGAVGSFNVDDNGLIYDDQGVITGVRHPFHFYVDPNTPNDHLIPFLLTMTAGNGYDPDDPNAPYIFQSRFYLIVQRGRELPRIISEDMVLTKDYYWLVPDQTLIEAGVTVTVTEGVQMQFYSTEPVDPYGSDPLAALVVRGNLRATGAVTEPVEIFLSSNYETLVTEVRKADNGAVELQYVRMENPKVKASLIDHCLFWGSGYYQQVYYYNGNYLYTDHWHYVDAPMIISSIFKDVGFDWYADDRNFHFNDSGYEFAGSIETSLVETSYFYALADDASSNTLHNNVFLNNTRSLSD